MWRRHMSYWGCWRASGVQLKENDGAAATLPSPESLASVNDDMMILVVDDHPINRRLLADQLGSLELSM